MKFRNLVIAVSLANFFLLSEWFKLLTTNHLAYFNASIPITALAADIIIFVFAAFVFYLALDKGEKFKNPTAKAFIYSLLMGVFLLALDKVRTQTGFAVPIPLLTGSKWEKIVIILFGLYFATVGSPRIRVASIWVFRNLLILLSPLLLTTMGRLARTAIHAPFPSVLATNVARASDVPSRRVVFIVFDEMDQYIAFPNGRSSVPLPEFSRLMKESLHAANAYPPSNTTLRSMPAYVTGRLIKEAKPMGESELGLDFDGKANFRSFSQEKTLFSEAKKLGFKSGLTGWYHPYCRVLQNTVDYCDSEAILQHPYRESVLSNLSLALKNAIGLTSDASSIHSEIYRHVLKSSLELAANPELGLIFLHFPVPHLPVVYQTSGKPYRYPANPLVEDYYNNLILADKTLGLVRAAIENAGLSQRTHLVVTSDHWWRHAPKEILVSQDNGEPQHRVPFLVKLAGEQVEMNYSSVFNSLISHDLVLALLKGELLEAKQIVPWLNSRRNTPIFLASPVISSQTVI